MNTKKQKILRLLIMCLLQIILLVVLPFAQSYFINQVSNTNAKKIENKKNNILTKKSFNFLISFFSIKQIGFVSAEEGCCAKTKNGAYCDYVDKNDCAGIFAEGVFCEDASFGENQCVLGCSVDYNNKMCMPYTPKIKSDEEKLDWEPSEDCSGVSNCEKGCCIVKGKGYYETKMACNARTQQNGVQENFTKDLNENKCANLHRMSEMGACVSSGGLCTYVSRENCANEFFPNIYCSDSSLKSKGVTCTKHAKKNCDKEFGQDVYWIDSCNNREEVAMDCKEGQERCSLKSGKPECETLNCPDENMKNSESKCIYDGSAGKGSDPVGSLHWKKICYEGEIKYENCGEARTGICQETTAENAGIKKAVCVPNMVEECFSITSKYFERMNSEISKYSDKERFEGTGEGEGGKETRAAQRNDDVKTIAESIINEMKTECDNNIYCMMKQSGEIDNYFSYDMCVPKDPRKINNSCEAATNTCIVYFRAKEGSGRFECKENCECLEALTFKKMNNLCTNIGDCGMYVNYYSKDGQSLNYGSNTLSYKPNIATKLSASFAENTIDDYDAIVAIKDETIYRKDKSGQGTAQSDFKINFGKLIIPNAIVLIAAQIISESPLALPSKPLELKYSREITEKVLGGDYSGFSQEAIEQAMKEYIKNNYDGSVESFIGRESYTWVDSWKYIKKQQREIKTLFGIIGQAILFRGIFNVWSWIIGAGDVERVEVTYNCLNWQAPTGGKDCNECNKGKTPCTKYKCESLGQACKMINDDTEYKKECISLEDDKKAPEIVKVKYKEKEITKSNNSWDITKNDCIPESTILDFNIVFDEPAQCKYGFESYSNYDDIPDNYPNNENKFLREHNFKVDVPSLAAILDTYNYNETADLFLTIRCIDIFGHFNSPEWLIDYCAKSGPDEYPPQILIYSPENKKQWEYKPDEIFLTVYTDENATCKYDSSNIDYENMQNMACDNSEIKGFGWPCTAKLENSILGANRVFIKCNDSNGNINQDPFIYEYEIKRDISLEDYIKDYGLKIDSVVLEIDEKNYNSGEKITTGKSPASGELKVQTSKGVDNGASLCSYGFSPKNINMYFKNTGTSQHKQLLNALEGKLYKIYIECEDQVSNATAEVNFTINIDKQSPVLVSHKEEGDVISIILDEPAKCAYTPSSCVFALEDGEAFNFGTEFKTEQSADWNPSITYFIKCLDEYENEGCAGQVGTGAPTGPIVTRIYYESGDLKIKTDRNAKCYYGFSGCGFNILANNTNTMSSDFTREHSVDWNSATTYYIRCKDKWNGVNPNCAVVVQPNSIKMN